MGDVRACTRADRAAKRARRSAPAPCDVAPAVFRIADLPYELQSLIVEQMPLRTMARLALTHADWAAMVQCSLRHGRSWAQSYADHRCCHDLTGDARAAIAPTGKWARKDPLEAIAASNAPFVPGVAICRGRGRRERLQLGRARRKHGRVRRVEVELGLVQLHAHLETLLPRLLADRVRVRVRVGVRVRVRDRVGVRIRVRVGVRIRVGVGVRIRVRVRVGVRAPARGTS